jgi:hypothetical protein
MQFVAGATNGALSTIALPDLQLDGCRDQAPAIRIDACGLREILLPFDRDKLESKNQTVLIALLPRINQVEHAILGPNTVADLFVDPNSFGQPFPEFRFLSRNMKLAVLGQAARRKPFGLVETLGI